MGNLYSIGVFGDPAIAEELRLLCRGRVNIPDITTLDITDGGFYDVLVVSEPHGGRLAATGQALVINSDSHEPLAEACLNAPRLVLTYGFNGKASVTASSVGDGSLTVCVQRTFTGISGVKRERQEFSVVTDNPRATLAAAAAALAADVDLL